MGIYLILLILSILLLGGYYYKKRMDRNRDYVKMFLSYLLIILFTGILYQTYMLQKDDYFIIFILIISPLLILQSDMSISFWERAIPNMGKGNKPNYVKRFNRYAYKIDVTEPLSFPQFPDITEDQDRKDLKKNIVKNLKSTLTIKRTLHLLAHLTWFSFVAMMYTLYNPLLLGYGPLPTLFKNPAETVFIYFMVITGFPFLMALLEILYHINPYCKGKSLYRGAEKTFRRSAIYNSFWAVIFFLLALYYRIFNLFAIKLYSMTVIIYIFWTVLFLSIFTKRGVVKTLLSFYSREIR